MFCIKYFFLTPIIETASNFVVINLLHLQTVYQNSENEVSWCCRLFSRVLLALQTLENSPATVLTDSKKKLEETDESEWVNFSMVKTINKNVYKIKWYYLILVIFSFITSSSESNLATDKDSSIMVVALPDISSILDNTSV